MMDDLISDQTKKYFGLKRSNILKVMNFLIFRDFQEFFLNFAHFIWIYLNALMW